MFSCCPSVPLTLKNGKSAKHHNEITWIDTYKFSPIFLLNTVSTEALVPFSDPQTVLEFHREKDFHPNANTVEACDGRVLKQKKKHLKLETAVLCL